MDYQQPDRRTPKRVAIVLVLLSAGVYFAANYEDLSSAARNRLQKQKATSDEIAEAEATPTASPTEEEVLTVGQLLKESKLKLKSERLAEPKLNQRAARPKAPQSPPSPASVAAQPAPGESAESTSTPAPPTPAESQPETANAPAPVATPEPSEQPLDPMTLGAEDLPPQVTLSRTTQFPLFMNGKRVGALTAVPGHVVRVTGIKPPLVEAEFRQSKEWISIENTDLVTLATASRKKRGVPVGAPAAETPKAAVSSPASSGTETSGSKPGSATILRVVPGGTTEVGNAQNTYPAIATALSQAQTLVAGGAAARIVIAPGDYTETLVWRGPETVGIGASLIIEAERPGSVRLTSKSGPAILVGGAAPVVVKGLVISGCGGAGVKASALGGSLVIENCIVRNNAMGLVVSGAPRVTVIGAAIVDNREGQVFQTAPNTAWDLRDSAIAALEPGNLGNVLDGIPGNPGETVSVARCVFFHPTLKNAFRMSDASLLGMEEWLRKVTDNGSRWSKDGAEQILANVSRPK